MRSLIILMLSFTSLHADPIYFPIAGGGYHVGFQVIEARNTTVPDPFERPDQGRRIKALVFYPVHGAGSFSGPPAELKAELMHDFHKNMRDLESSWYYYFRSFIPWLEQSNNPEVTLLEQTIAEIKIPHQKNAKQIDNRTFPVIYFVSNVMNSPHSYLTFIHRLVAQGYIVVAPYFTYLSTIVKFSDGAVYQGLEQLNQKTALTAMGDDLEFLINNLPGLFQSKSADFSRIGFIGHAWGAKAILQRFTGELPVSIFIDADCTESLRQNENHLHTEGYGCLDKCKCSLIPKSNPNLLLDSSFLYRELYHKLVAHYVSANVRYLGQQPYRNQTAFYTLTESILEKLRTELIHK